MTHPHQLHALAAAWSLTSARRQLALTVGIERATQRRDAIATAAAAAIQAWRPVIGRGSGGHGDPVAGAVVGVAHSTTRELRPGRMARRAERATATLLWLADRLQLATAGDPLDAIRHAIPHLPAAAAAELTLHLREEDTRIRDALLLDPAEQLLVGVACPSCGVRQVYEQTVGERLVVCRAGCRCAGDGCTCRMEVRVEGVAHIWARHVVLGAVAGNAPTTTN